MYPGLPEVSATDLESDERPGTPGFVDAVASYREADDGLISSDRGAPRDRE